MAACCGLKTLTQRLSRTPFHLLQSRQIKTSDETMAHEDSGPEEAMTMEEIRGEEPPPKSKMRNACGLLTPR